jgi:hypothetical protein
MMMMMMMMMLMHTQLSAPLVSVSGDESGCTTSSKRTDPKKLPGC